MGTAHHNLLPASLLRGRSGRSAPVKSPAISGHLPWQENHNYGDLKPYPRLRLPMAASSTRWRKRGRAGRWPPKGRILLISAANHRPGFKPVPEEEELERVMPVITALKDDPQFNTPLSIDTYKAGVARRALEAGVEMVNDVWGLKKEPRLAEVAAAYKVPLCLMHNRNDTNYRDLISEVIEELEESIALALTAGVTPNNIIIDPGSGSVKTCPKLGCNALPLF